MIIRKAAASFLRERFGGSGDTRELPGEALGTLVYNLPPRLFRPLTAIPLRYTQCARIAMLASWRVFSGFSPHNACYELTFANYRTLLANGRPDYLLVESCIYDSARNWPLGCFKSEYVQWLKSLADLARKNGIPSIFWHTLDRTMADYFLAAMGSFDFLACADPEALDYLSGKGLEPRYLPWGFAPEQFNPLVNTMRAAWPPMLLFDGVSRMMRFSHVRDTLDKLVQEDLEIIDTGLFVPPYNLGHFDRKDLAAHVAGNISQTYVQELYKTATACLSMPDMPGFMAPTYICNALQAAACSCPVLQCGNAGANSQFLAGFTQTFADPRELSEYYQTLRGNAWIRASAGHKAWRAAHTAHTFAHRMRTFHDWIGLDKKALEQPLASIVVPSMRPRNFDHALAQYNGQTYGEKEFIYVFNGRRQDAPEAGEQDRVRILATPAEHSTGMVMNAGICAANGEYIFKFDDDDLYGPDYVLDRMIFFREFNIQALSNASSFFTFGKSGEAILLNSQDCEKDNSVFAMGNAAYSMLRYTGASFAMQTCYARSAPFQELAFAHADVASLLKGIFLTPCAVYAKLEGFNFCVVRHEASAHTWAAGKEELLNYAAPRAIPLSDVFI